MLVGITVALLVYWVGMKITAPKPVSIRLDDIKPIPIRIPTREPRMIRDPKRANHWTADDDVY